MEQVLASNQDLASRIRGLEREGSIFSQEARDNASTIQPHSRQRPSSFIEKEIAALRFTFDGDLEASRVYNRAILNRHSMSSFTSTALYATAMSVFSKLSLSQVSNISFYALPVYSDDLSNSHFYVFGDEGAIQRLAVKGSSSSTESGASAQSLKATKEDPRDTPSDARNLQPLSASRLLGRFARRRNLPSISAPENPVHVTHVEYDMYTMELKVI